MPELVERVRALEAQVELFLATFDAWENPKRASINIMHVRAEVETLRALLAKEGA